MCVCIIVYNYLIVMLFSLSYNIDHYLYTHIHTAFYIFKAYLARLRVGNALYKSYYYNKIFIPTQTMSNLVYDLLITGGKENARSNRELYVKIFITYFSVCLLNCLIKWMSEI